MSAATITGTCTSIGGCLLLVVTGGGTTPIPTHPFLSLFSRVSCQGAVILHLSWGKNASSAASGEGAGGGSAPPGSSAWAFVSWNGGLSEPGRWGLRSGV